MPSARVHAEATPPRQPHALSALQRPPESSNACMLPGPLGIRLQQSGSAIFLSNVVPGSVAANIPRLVRRLHSKDGRSLVVKRVGDSVGTSHPASRLSLPRMAELLKQRPVQARNRASVYAARTLKRRR